MKKFYQCESGTKRQSSLNLNLTSLFCCIESRTAQSLLSHTEQSARLEIYGLVSQYSCLSKLRKFLSLSVHDQWGICTNTMTSAGCL